MTILKDLKLKDIIYQKVKSKIRTWSSMEKKNFYDQAIDSDIKLYEDIRKLTIGQGEDYTTGFLLDDGYIKKHYRLKAVNLSRKKELDADPKAIQQIEFVGKLKNIDGINADGTQSMFVLKILEKVKETRLKFSQGNVTVLWKIANCQEVRVKLTNTQLTKLKSAAKSKTRTMLKLTKKNFGNEELPY